MTQARKPRQHKTPRQRAEEALGVAERATQRADDKVTRLRGELAEALEEYRSAKRRRDFLTQSPDLSDEPIPDFLTEEPEQDPTTDEEQ